MSSGPSSRKKKSQTIKKKKGRQPRTVKDFDKSEGTVR
jgi:hypothetical protein